MLTRGKRAEVVALVAAAVEPKHFASFTTEEGIRSFSELFSAKFSYAEAPELLCLDLYQAFDLTQLTVLAAPTIVNVDDKGPTPIFWK
jgi:hypothetical protein